MTLRRRALTLGACLVLAFFEYPAEAAVTPAPTPSPAPFVAERIANATHLYSPHARRLVQSYLRLEMLELRKADLERVRAVIERRLDVDALLAPSETPAARLR
jgi:hypothetical protein